jgi:hypothetical protein
MRSQGAARVPRHVYARQESNTACQVFEKWRRSPQSPRTATASHTPPTNARGGSPSRPSPQHDRSAHGASPGPGRVLRLAEHQVHDPALSDVRPSTPAVVEHVTPAVGEHIVVVAARVLERFCEDRHRGITPLLSAIPADRLSGRGTVVAPMFAPVFRRRMLTRWLSDCGCGESDAIKMVERCSTPTAAAVARSGRGRVASFFPI